MFRLEAELQSAPSRDLESYGATLELAMGPAGIMALSGDPAPGCVQRS